MGWRVTKPLHAVVRSTPLEALFASKPLNLKENILMRHHRLVLICYLAAIAATQGLVFAQSQANTGAIEGIVNDPSGRAVASAQVTVTNLGTNFSRSLTTDAEGRFRGLLLPLGPYKVTVKAPNF